MEIKQLLSLFSLREIEVEIFKELFYGGVMSASKLAKQVNISRTSIYDLLKKLLQIGLISETMKDGVKMFVVQPPEKIHLLIKEKEKEIDKAKQEFKGLQKEYQNNCKILQPRLQLFEGREALQQMMKDMLLYRDITTYAYWPVRKIVALLSPEFFLKFHQERISRNIQLKTIWPQNQIPAIKLYSFLGVKPEFKREVRIAPSKVVFSLGYVVYGNTVRFISSRKETFGFLVESSELAEMMKSQFKAIWDLSKDFSEFKK